MVHFLSSSGFIILIGWLVALAIFFGFIILLRYLQHRERMALITQGIQPSSSKKIDVQRQQKRNRMLRAGLIIALVGFTLTIGLYPVGFLLPAPFTSIPFHLGPWLLPGFIPFGVGCALVISYYLEQPAQGIDEDESDEDNRLTPLPLDKKRHHQ